MNIAKIIKIKDGESVVRIVRQYGLMLWRQVLLAVCLVYAPFFFMVPLLSTGRWGLGIFGFTVAIGVLYTLRLIIMWRWNAFVVTSHRVVDIDQRGFFERIVSEAPYDRIQDVSYRVKGILGAMFGYGTVSLQTAGSAMTLEMHGVHGPRDLHHLITEQMHRRQGIGGAAERSDKVAQLLDGASDMSDAEARAFVLALQEAMKDTRKLGWSGKDVDEQRPS